MTEEDLNQIRSIVDRSAEAVIGNISDLRQEMNARFARVDQRFDTVERRLERVEYQTLGMNKSLTDAERIDTVFAATQAAHQRAIDDLYAQIAELKRQRPAQ